MGDFYFGITPDPGLAGQFDEQDFAAFQNVDIERAIRSQMRAAAICGIPLETTARVVSVRLLD